MRKICEVKEIIEYTEDTLKVLDYKGELISFEKKEGVVVGKDYNSEIVLTGNPVRTLGLNGNYKIIGRNNEKFIIQPYFREEIKDVFNMYIFDLEKIKEFALTKFYC